jgi:hypothetical protein
VQQVFALSEGNMKYCAHDRHPPHSIVAVSRIAMPQLAIFLNTRCTQHNKYWGFGDAYFFAPSEAHGVYSSGARSEPQVRQK